MMLIVKDSIKKLLDGRWSSELFRTSAESNPGTFKLPNVYFAEQVANNSFSSQSIS